MANNYDCLRHYVNDQERIAKWTTNNPCLGRGGMTEHTVVTRVITSSLPLIASICTRINFCVRLGVKDPENCFIDQMSLNLNHILLLWLIYEAVWGLRFIYVLLMEWSYFFCYMSAFPQECSPVCVMWQNYDKFSKVVYYQYISLTV